jgi:hypothetical protein
LAALAPENLAVLLARAETAPTDWLGETRAGGAR